MNFLYQSLAAAAGLSEITAGQRIKIPVSLLLGHDGTAAKLLQAWERAGFEKVFDGRKVMITLDHQLPAPTPAARSLHRKLQDFADRQNIRLYHRGEGVLHQVVAETESLRPGMILAGADGHVATSGAFGAIAFSLKPEEMVLPLATGVLEIEVPEIVRVEIQNQLQPPSSPRDLALTLTGLLGHGLARGKAVLLSGPGVWGLSSSGKMTVCNMLGETGALTGLIVPPEMISGAESKDAIHDAAEIKPVVACPPEPANIRPVADLVGLKVTQVVVGGCSSGRMEDMFALIKGLKGRKVHPQTNLIVTPASPKVAQDMETEGLTRLLRSAGAILNPPGCGPCAGQHLGLLGAGDRAVAAIVRNTSGRMGAPDAEIYLASPWTAGLTAAAGVMAIE